MRTPPIAPQFSARYGGRELPAYLKSRLLHSGKRARAVHIRAKQPRWVCRAEAATTVAALRTGTQQQPVAQSGARALMVTMVLLVLLEPLVLLVPLE